MAEISGNPEVNEAKKFEVKEAYKEIKPENRISIEDAKSFWDKLFEGKLTDDITETVETDNPEKSLEKTVDDYIKDLKEKSECPETIPDKPFEASDLKKRTPEENAEMRDKFDDEKARLKIDWEKANGRLWPKYDQDVYSSNGRLIRKAGSDYDAHHIQPLSMGGKNEVSNITPLSAEVHYDKQGVHAPDSPYNKLDQLLGGGRD